MLFRMCWLKVGEKVDVDVFTGPGTLSLDYCGTLTFSNGEWEVFKENTYRFMEAGSDIEFVPETNR